MTSSTIPRQFPQGSLATKFCFYSVIASLLLPLPQQVAPGNLHAQDNQPTSSISNSVHRSPWTTSRIQGSPETPLPYIFEAVFPKLRFNNALEMISIGERLLVVEKDGKIWTFPENNEVEKADLLIDLKSLHQDMTFAYGIAFHPQWKTNKEVFITYTLGKGLEDGSRLSRFRLVDSDTPKIDPTSEEILLTWRSGGHNGANLRFGHDGMLYISTGDATVPAPPDQLSTGQDNSDLLAAVLRIDVDHSTATHQYAIPKANPFVAMENVRPEIWAFGFRNPWKMSFGPDNRLWIGDVGWELWEMIHLVKKGSNAGWSAMEASQPIKPGQVSPLAPITPPIAAHPHTEASSITGGYVYQGARLSELRDAYIYGDYTTGKIWALWHDGKKTTKHEEIADTPHQIATFGEGQNGTLYYIDYATPSGIYRLKPNPRAGEKSDFPLHLSKTGLFNNTARQTPAEGVYEYQIIEEMWQDGASSQRFIALPDKNKIDTVLERRADKSIKKSTVTWPVDSVLVKTISTGKPSKHKIETQLLHYDGENWNGYSYRWNDDGSDAELVAAEGEEINVPSKGWKGGSRYRIHSRSECSRCHSWWNRYTLGFQPWQLKQISNNKNSSPQETAIALGLCDEDFFVRNAHDRLTSSHGDGGIEARSRSWLHVNCSSCHRRNGGGSAPLEINFEVPLAETSMINEMPTRGDFGLTDARVIVPGKPEQSILFYRLTSIGSAHMPLIGAREVDESAEALLTHWIRQLPHSGQADHDGRTAQEAVQKNEASANSTTEAIRTASSIASGKMQGELRESAIESGLASSDANIRALFLRFLPPDQRPRTLGPNIDTESLLKLAGNPQRGAQILSLTGKWAACLACHTIHESGGSIGPDLSEIGNRLSKAQMIESLVSPSKIIAPEFQTWQIETTDGKTLAGFKTTAEKGDTNLKDDITLGLVDGSTQTIARKNIKTMNLLPNSLMPEGLLQALTQQEAADVLAWLSSLK